MAYCILTDIQKTVPSNDLIQLTDDSSPPVAINQANVDRAIADASELIDGYLRGRYALPLKAVPGLVNTLSADIAIYRLYARRVKLTPPEGVSERYKNALKLLEQIQKGIVSIGTENLAGGSVTPESGGPQFVAPDRVFTRPGLSDY